MTTTRKPLTRADLTPLTRAALNRTPTAVTRIRGGSKKGVYRLTFDDGPVPTAVAYVWSPEEDLWDAGPGDPRDPFSHASGLSLFTAAADRLAATGVRAPRLLHADPTHTHLPADAAIVEDLPGGTLEDLLAGDPAAVPDALERMAALLATLHACTGPRFGKVAVVDNGGSSYGSSCERIVVERALADLDELPARDPRAAAAHPQLAHAIKTLAARVRPRTEPATLVHGELGPDHVRVTPDGDLALIDIEGLMYFDLEWEHVFLRLRFGRHYDALRTEGLDEDRLRLYRLAMHLSLVAGPLRLLDVGDFHDPEFMRGIAEHNLQQALSLVERT
ncbi:phosphotransferase family protein [Streptomyces xylophagus]|uniref:phosphotransferase family protein n=1 Tax=Streptomyces xylophagus TaxID=285514 RepID=UPI0005B9260D|nr:aminoglycoside phosphotransferase family protein [Streptomyces xylophagus]